MRDFYEISTDELLSVSGGVLPGGCVKDNFFIEFLKHLFGW